MSDSDNEYPKMRRTVRCRACGWNGWRDTDELDGTFECPGCGASNND